MEKPTPHVKNVVVTVKLECEPIQISRLSKLLPYSSYDRTRFAAVTIRLLEPSSTILLFCSGKLVVTGASTCEEALLSAYHIVDVLKDTHPGQDFKLVSYEIQNIVSSLAIPISQGQGLDLKAFYRDYGADSTFQSTQFPGLMWRSTVTTPVMMLLFSSAKVVITGAKSLEQINRAWDYGWPIVRQYITEL